MPKNFCLVPASWKPHESVIHRCDDRSHRHLSRAQVWQLELDGVIEWIRQPKNNRDRGIVRMSRLIPVRGLSCRIGEPLAEALRARLPWARVMLSEIQTEPASRI